MIAIATKRGLNLEESLSVSNPRPFASNDSQEDSQHVGLRRTKADAVGMCRQAIELQRASTDAHGWQPRGLQNRLRALETRVPLARASPFMWCRRGLLSISAHNRQPEERALARPSVCGACSAANSSRRNSSRYRARLPQVSYAQSIALVCGVSNRGKSHPTLQRRSSPCTAVVPNTGGRCIPSRATKHFPDLGPGI